MTTLFSSETAVPMTIFLPGDEPGGADGAMLAKEIWVFTVEQLEHSLRIEQDHVFRHFPEHRQMLTYEASAGPYYVVRGHGQDVSASTVANFRAEWPERSTTMDVVAVLD